MWYFGQEVALVYGGIALSTIAQNAKISESDLGRQCEYLHIVFAYVYVISRNEIGFFVNFFVKTRFKFGHGQLALCWNRNLNLDHVVIAF
jgi:hypothetical protein